MHQWMNVFNEGDLRYILIEYDESISNTDLTPYFDVLMQEDEALKGSSDYDIHLQKVDDTLYKEYVIRACTIIIYCISYGMKEEANKLITDFDLNIKLDEKKIVDKNAIAKLESKIKQIRTVLKINEIQEKEDPSYGKKAVWEDKIVYIHQITGVQMDYNCSVALYRSYEKMADRIIKARKKNG